MTLLRTCAMASLAAGVMLGMSEPALADEVTVTGIAEPDVLSERVFYGDLDLASERGAKALNYRVSGAVKRVCAPLDERLRVHEMFACRGYAWDGAKPQIDLALTRAQELAATGTTSIAPVAILITVPAR